MAKQINTRIQLKYDSWAGWSATNEEGKGAKLILKAGEIGICQIPAETNAGQSTSEPVVLFKVGNGTSEFSALPWTSAKAADVYGWAKQASLPVERATTETGDAGNVISTIKFEGGKIVYTTATVATSEGLAQLTERVGTIESTMATDDELETAVNTINQTIATLATKEELAAVDAKFANYTTTTAQQAIDAEQDRRLGVIEGDYVKAADIANFETKENVKKVADDLAGYKTSNNEALAAVKATADAAAVKTEVETALADRYTKAEADAAFDAKGDAAQALTDAKGYVDT